MGTSYTKLRLFFQSPSLSAHFFHIWWHTPCHSHKTLCCTIGALRLRCISAVIEKQHTEAASVRGQKGWSQKVVNWNC